MASSQKPETLYASLETGANQAKASRIDADKILLELQSGEFNTQEAWFLKDEDNQEYIVLPQNLLNSIIQTIKKAYEDKLKVELERDIATQTPIDFDDVLAVAFKRLESYRRSDGSLPRIDTRSFVKQIKKEYPNLFFDLDDYFRKQKSLDQ
ncbi:hypothetical protein BKH46_03505 [Helicobacter sp. 12S02634-8]|nr:hypothetical protein BKH46_03505 [Helicobacter sp. 12S02634-8]